MLYVQVFFGLFFFNVYNQFNVVQVLIDIVLIDLVIFVGILKLKWDGDEYVIYNYVENKISQFV